MTLDADDRAMARKMDKERLFDLLDELKAAAKAVLDGLRETPGGDAFVYGGSMNDVEWLRCAADAWEQYQMETEAG